MTNSEPRQKQMQNDFQKAASGYNQMQYDPLYAAAGGLIASLAAGIGPAFSVAVGLVSGVAYWALRQRATPSKPNHKLR